MKPTMLRSPSTGERLPGLEVDARSIGPWRPTVAGVREAALRWHVTAADFSQQMPLDPLGKLFMPRLHEIEAIADATRDAVTYGRVIDFGFLPNEVIKFGGMRGGPLWNSGAYGQPFREPWVLYHTWDYEPGGPHAVAVYLVSLADLDNPCGDCEVVELQPTQFGEEQRVLLICDRVIFEADPDSPLADAKYRCRSAPAMLRYLNGPGSDRINQGTTPEGAAAGNCGDPLMTALMILNTRGIERETVEPPPKLNKSRMRSGKPPIPPYDRIDSGPYVTAILSRRRPRGEPKGGTHASPTPHIRLGHPRTYANGSRSLIRDTLVNVTDEARAAFQRSRSHYVIR